MNILKVLRSNMHFFAMLFLFILMSIGYLTTNNLSRIPITAIRYASISLVLFFIIMQILSGKIRLNAAIGLFSYFIAIIYALFTSFANGAIEIGVSNIFINMAVTVSAIYLFSSRQAVWSLTHGRLIVFYVATGFILTVWVGGIDLSFPPRFLFEYSSDINGSQIVYSQGISKFFGYGAIACVFLLINSDLKITKFLSALMMIIFSLLSLLGGGRGESLAALGVIMIYIFMQSPGKFIFFIAAVLSSTLMLSVDWSWMDDFLIFQRLSAINDGNFGSRDLLINDAFNLLLNEPRCIVYGCGLGFFQSYYSYEYGMYPHNFMVESFIVFGIPLATLFFAASCGGLIVYYKKHKKIDLFILFLSYTFIIDMKSGALFGGWMTMASIFYLIGLLVEKMIVCNSRKNFLFRK